MLLMYAVLQFMRKYIVELLKISTLSLLILLLIYDFSEHQLKHLK